MPGYTTFFTIFLICLSILAQSQQSEKKITLKVKNKSLEAVLKTVSEQCEIPVSYSHEQVPLAQKISVNIKNKSLDNALEEILKPLKLTHVFVENQIIIKPMPKKEPEPPAKAEVEPKFFTISGSVKDKESGESVAGATVYTNDLKYGTTTNGYGFYSITLSENNYTLVCSFIGYKNITQDVDLNKNYKKDFQLEIDELILEVVIITTKEDSNKFIAMNRMGYSEMVTSKVARMPMFFVEPDVIKAMQYMPGIKNTIDGSSNYYIRGGERDQNLILLDDAPIYNPSHLFGFFTCINPEALTDIKLYKSDFPSYVGGKLSSVLELKTKEGNLNKFSASGEIGLITTRLSAESPLFKKTGSFFISYRRSHIESIAKRINSNIKDFRFNDLNAKFNFKINKNNRLLFSLYSGNDYFYVSKNNEDKRGINWGNFTSSIRWNKIYGSKLFSNTTLYFSNYDYNLYTSVKNNTRWNSKITTMGLKSDFTYYKNPKTTRYLGFQISANNINPGVVLSNHNISSYNIPNIQILTTEEINLYYSSNHNLKDNFIVRYGLRATSFSNRGPMEWYPLSDDYTIIDTIKVEGNKRYNTYFRWEPSLTLTYLINTTSSVKFNYFRAHQYYQILSNSISPFTSIEVWYPSTPNVKPQSADQISLGYFLNFGKYRYSLSVEGYYKFMNHQFDYNNQALLLLNPYIEEELRFGKTNAYGTEITLKKEIGRLQGWLGYAFSRAIRKTEMVNNNLPYFAYSDRPYDISIYLQYQLSARWLITSGFVFVSGMPFTTPTGYYDYQGYKVPVYSEKNNSRMPDYHRLDLSCQYMFNKPGKKWQHYMTFSIINLTNVKNPAFINFNKIINDSGNFVIPSNYAADYETHTSKIVLLGIIPGLKYNFKF